AQPDENLLLAVLFRRLLPVEALEGAVVALVEPPVAADRNPMQPHLSQGDLGGVDRPQQKRGVDDPATESFLGHQAARLAALFLAGLGEGDVGPAGEHVLEIPGRLTVPEQHQFHDHDLRPPVSLSVLATRRWRTRRGWVWCGGAARPGRFGIGPPPTRFRRAGSPGSGARRIGSGPAPARPPARSPRRWSPRLLRWDRLR